MKPNFNNIGQKFGKNTKDIVALLKSTDVSIFINTIKNKGEYLIPNTEYIVSTEDVEIIENGIAGYSLSSNNQIIVSLNTHLNKELINEGLVRDLIRKVQDLRKNLGFEVEDRIKIDITCSDDIYNAINDNLEYFNNETLCTNITKSNSINSGNIHKININSENILLLINKVL